MHKNSLLLFEKYAKPYFSDVKRVLEIGPAEFPSAYFRSVNRNDLQWDTLDVKENPSLTYSAVREYEYPVNNSVYDIVFSGQVLEHVRKIWRWMPELARITKPRGFVITISPVSYPYHGSSYDCWRIYPEGMRVLCEDSGLETETCVWESIEGHRYRRVIGGIGEDRIKGKLRFVWRILATFGFPMQVAFDMVTIARKRG